MMIPKLANRTSLFSRGRGLLACLVILIASGFSASAQDHVTSNASDVYVQSASISGRIVIGPAVVGRIESSVTHGWWSLRSTSNLVTSVYEAEETSGVNTLNGRVTFKATEHSEVFVRDLTGKEVKVSIQRKNNQAMIDLSTVIPGVYLVQVVDGKNVQHHRVLSSP